MKKTQTITILIFLALFVLSACESSITAFEATNPDDSTSIFCPLEANGTDCYGTLSGSIAINPEYNLCLYVTFNRGQPDFLAGSGPIQTAIESEQWTMLSFGLDEGNALGIPRVMFTAMLGNEKCLTGQELLAIEE
ncbi:MAG: hypothetical protein JW750_05740 [Anaerolineaceae bacterium]|nr:hypothetical protein [Anaerolineaceae bacterium]